MVAPPDIPWVRIVLIIAFMVWMWFYGWNPKVVPMPFEAAGTVSEMNPGMTLDNIDMEVKCEVMQGRIICPPVIHMLKVRP